MSRPYTGWDGDATGKRAGLEKLVDLCEQHFGLWNNGTWGVRKKRGKSSKSVHGTARAGDISWRGAPYRGTGNYHDAVRMMDFLTRPDVADALGIEAVFDYYPKPHGRGWKCDRAAWQVYDKPAFSGAPGGDWVHVEISNEHADDPDYINHWFLHLIGDLPAASTPAPAPAPEATPMRAYPGTSLRRGSKGEHVKMVQRVVGAYADGDFGPKTEQAVKTWQAAHAAQVGPADGIVGPRTWAAMFP